MMAVSLLMRSILSFITDFVATHGLLIFAYFTMYLFSSITIYNCDVPSCGHGGLTLLQNFLWFYQDLFIGDNAWVPLPVVLVIATPVVIVELLRFYLLERGRVISKSWSYLYIAMIASMAVLLFEYSSFLSGEDAIGVGVLAFEVAVAVPCLMICIMLIKISVAHVRSFRCIGLSAFAVSVLVYGMMCHSMSIQGECYDAHPGDAKAIEECRLAVYGSVGALLIPRISGFKE